MLERSLKVSASRGGGSRISAIPLDPRLNGQLHIELSVLL